MVSLGDVKPSEFRPTCTYCTDYWWRYDIFFSAFAGYGSKSIINHSKFFMGCGKNKPSELEYLEYRNMNKDSMFLCIDDVALI